MLGEILTRQQAASIVARAARGSERVLELPPDLIRTQYDQQPFLIGHRLHEHPLFELSSLQALCHRRRDLVGVRAGTVPVTTDFARSFAQYPLAATVEQAIDDPVAHGAYVMITNPERDEQYRELILSMLGEVALATRAVESRMTWLSGYVFISSRAACTPYHMDREMNFLLQVRGQKSVNLWSGKDDDVMSEAQRDELLAYAREDRPPYHPELDDRAHRFVLGPGQGVHHPFIAPHIVSTASDLSISFALTYRTVRTDVMTAAHRVNHRLRSRGLNPKPVGRNGLVDRSKAAAYGAWQMLRKIPRSRSSTA